MKREYMKPSMRVVKFIRRTQLLTGSTTSSNSNASVNAVYEGQEDI